MGFVSASSGSHSRAASRVPSLSGIQMFSMWRILCGYSVLILTFTHVSSSRGVIANTPARENRRWPAASESPQLVGDELVAGREQRFVVGEVEPGAEFRMEGVAEDVDSAGGHAALDKEHKASPVRFA